jgi:pyruvate/2-oxoglutarate dehydrogenase complex dihydrolipoamide dehydrogenase (E3) component
VEGLAEAGYLTNETVFSLTERPDRLVVVGGGPVGCELAQTFRRLGSEVDIVGRAPQFLPREDQDAAAIVEAAFRKEGIGMWLGTSLKKVGMTGGGKIVYIEKDGVEHTLEANEILVGAGRAPNVEGLNLESAGVEFDKNGVTVNDSLQTTNKRIYAAGDVCMKYKFTHTADFTARIVIQNALFFGRKKLSALTVPWTTYTDPEIAHVGMYEQDAAEEGFEVETFKKDFADVDRAIAEGEEEGFVKIHVKKGSDQILGATIVARHAGEMISEITLAIVGGLGLGTLSRAIHPYPTQAEAIRQLGDEYNRTRLTPFVKNVFTRLLAWRR